MRFYKFRRISHENRRISTYSVIASVAIYFNVVDCHEVAISATSRNDGFCARFLKSYKNPATSASSHPATQDVNTPISPGIIKL
ncbi:hypothetical protein ACWIUD_02705 [Helicobacter sp. 23-1044]